MSNQFNNQSAIPEISIDIGYSSSKILFNNQYSKIATAISFANDAGIDFGESSIYQFEGKRYFVGAAATEESFTTTNYKFLYDYSPMIVFHILKKLGIEGDVRLKTGLALTDWGKRDEITTRLNTINIGIKNPDNHLAMLDLVVNTNCKVVGPQGSGAYVSYISYLHMLHNKKIKDAIIPVDQLVEIPKSLIILDIGYRTINFLYYENGKANQAKMKGFPGHGVVSIMKTFSSYLESTYGMPFSEQEALQIFLNNEFIMDGEKQLNIPPMVTELKSNFVQKLINSVLVSEVKLLRTSEAVLISGGGAYYLEGVLNMKNVVFGQKPYEFANVYGYSLMD